VPFLLVFVRSPLLFSSIHSLSPLPPHSLPSSRFAQFAVTLPGAICARKREKLLTYRRATLQVCSSFSERNAKHVSMILFKRLGCPRRIATQRFLKTRESARCAKLQLPFRSFLVCRGAVKVRERTLERAGARAICKVGARNSAKAIRSVSLPLGVISAARLQLHSLAPQSAALLAFPRTPRMFAETRLSASKRCT